MESKDLILIMLALLVVIFVLWKLTMDVQKLKKEQVQTRTPLFRKKRVGFANKEKEPDSKKDEKDTK